MHVFTFSVRHYKPRACYKSLPHAVEPIGTDTMQNQQRIVIVLGRVHGMCWCDTHSWLQYDGGISGSCCYGSCWSFKSNVQFGMKMTLLGNTLHFALNAFAMLQKHVFCLRLLWQEDHVLISICCTSTIHLHFRPHGKHSTHCANRSDPCRKAPAFSVPSDGAYRADTLGRSWTWLICKVGARTRLRTHGTFETPGFIVRIEANKFVYHWKLQKEKEMTRHQVREVYGIIFCITYHELL